MKPKLIRVTTIPISMNILLKNQLRFMSEYFEVIGVSSKDKKHFYEVTARENVPMVEVELTRSISPVKDLIALIKMFLFFVKEKPTIVHSHTPKAGLIAMLAAKMARVPVRIHTLAGMPLMELKGLKRLLLLLSEKTTYYCATRVFPNSFGLYHYVTKEKMASPSKLKVIGNGSSNGIDINYFKPDYNKNWTEIRTDIRKEHKIGPQDIVFCYVGRIVKDKGINELIQAFLMLENYANSQKKAPIGKKPVLLFVGLTGTEDLPSSDSLKTMNNNPNIKLVGRHDDIRPYFLASDVFALPSYREGFPNSVMQAGAMGLPSIVSDINGCNEIIYHGSNGLIIPPKDAYGLYEAMKKIFFDDDLRERLASVSREKIVSRFNQKDFFLSLLQEYQDSLSRLKKTNKD